MLTPIIREDLLYYIWKTKSFDMAKLKTTDNQEIQILDFGTHNHDSGPDFSNGKVKIGNTTWIGNIEMHVYSSDWERHCHDLDKAYDNVILHVVFEHDKEVRTTTEHLIPCLELKQRISNEILKKYGKLIANDNWIPCQNQIGKIENYTISFWLQRLAAERIEHKTEYLKKILERTNSNWEETLYIFLSRYMGARVNMEPFERLARITPYILIQKNRYDLLKIEALLFGQAGMLMADFQDQYFRKLKKEYRFLTQKHNLKKMNPISWKFSRMRPAGFPTIKIAQLAQILINKDRLFNLFISAHTIEDIRKVFFVKTSDYWDNHYKFGKTAVFKEKKLGSNFIDQLIINVVCPVLFLYGKHVANESLCEKAILHLEQTKAESNKIVNQFKKEGLTVNSASDSQALLELKKNYCDEKLCATCAIGNSILKKNK